MNYVLGFHYKYPCFPHCGNFVKTDLLRVSGLPHRQIFKGADLRLYFSRKACLVML